MNGHIIYKLSGMSHQNTFSVNSMKHFSYLLPFSSGCLFSFCTLNLTSTIQTWQKVFLNTVVCASYQKKFAIKLSFVLGHILKSHDYFIKRHPPHGCIVVSIVLGWQWCCSTPGIISLKINALVPSYLSSSISQLKSEEYC